MTRTDRQILTATFLFALVGLAAMAIVAPRFIDHLQPLPPLETPRDEPPEVEPAAPMTSTPAPPPVPRAKPKVARRTGKRAPDAQAVKVRLDCDGDPLCGVVLPE